MAELTVVRVFVNDDGEAGNPLGVFLEGNEVPEGDRQAVAADLNFSETVFVLDPAGGRLQIFTPAAELAFAGHPLVGTSWLLRENRRAVEVLRPPAGDVHTWVEGTTTWIRGRAKWAPSMELRQYDSAERVDELNGPPPGVGVLYAWAWLDEPAGRIRARSFAPALGITEDEATGAATLRLTATLGRALEVRQGRGSVLLGRPGPDGTVEVGGRVSFVSQSHYSPG